MNEDYFERTRDELEEAINERMGYSPQDERTMHRNPFLEFLSQRRIVILVGAAILLFVILIALFSRTSSELSKKDLTAISTRIDLLERRLIRIEKVEPVIPTLQKQAKMLEQSIGETDTSIKLLIQRVDAMNQRLEVLQNKTLSAAKGAQESGDAPEKQASPDKRRVHVVSRGENLYRISSKYGLTVDELCRLNNMRSSQPIHPGQELLIVPKSE
jgi:LysM repeat protein